MTTEIKHARTRVTPSLAKDDAPDKLLSQQPMELRNIPFADDKDYIRADQQDRIVGVVVTIAAVVVLAVSFCERMP